MSTGGAGPGGGSRILGLLPLLKGRRPAEHSVYLIERREGFDSWVEVSRFGLMEEAAAALDEIVAETGDDAGNYRISEVVGRGRPRAR
jgi:hypothetical protein